MSPEYFANQLSEDIEHAQKLLTLINEEQQALVARDLPKLETLLDHKQPILILLAQHASERSRFLQDNGFSADRDGLISFCKAQNLGNGIVESADVLANVIEQCRDTNEQHGRAIRSYQAATGKVLGLLRGTDAPSLYDQKGASSKSSQARPLSQA